MKGGFGKKQRDRERGRRGNLPKVGEYIEVPLEWEPFSDANFGDRALASTAALAYTLGLRHALDADHISVCRAFWVLAPPAFLFFFVHVLGG